MMSKFIEMIKNFFRRNNNKMLETSENNIKTSNFSKFKKNIEFKSDDETIFLKKRYENGEINDSELSIVDVIKLINAYE